MHLAVHLQESYVFDLRNPSLSPCPKSAIFFADVCIADTATIQRNLGMPPFPCDAPNHGSPQAAML